MRRVKSQKGFTLIEVLIAIGLMIILLSLVFLPILSAYGFVQKVRDISEVRNNTDRVITDIKKTFESASAVNGIAPDGTIITLLISSDNSNSSPTLVRYMRSLNNPFYLDPDTGMNRYAVPNFYPTVSNERKFSNIYAPFSTSFGRANPYILGKSIVENGGELKRDPDLSFEGKLLPFWEIYYPIVRNPAWPLSSIIALTAAEEASGYVYPPEFVRSEYGTHLISMYPANIRYDVEVCTFTPLRVLNERMKMAETGTNGVVPTYATARYGGWIGANKTLDDILHEVDRDYLYDTFLEGYYQSDSSVTNAEEAVTKYSEDYYRGKFYRLGSNPFGYDVKIFDLRGDLVYGLNSSGEFISRRHIMDWPKRPLIGDNAGYVDGDSNFWQFKDVAAQRERGIVTFAQHVKLDEILLAYDGTYGYLELPDSWKWIIGANTYAPYEETYMAALVNNKIVLKDNSDNNVEFVRVNRSSDLNEKLDVGQFYVPSIGEFNYESRKIIFNRPLQDFDITVPDNPSDRVPIAFVNPLSAVICDVQPGDRIIANYSTAAVINLHLKVTRSSQKVTSNSGQDPVVQEFTHTFNLPKIYRRRK